MNTSRIKSHLSSPNDGLHRKDWNTQTPWSQIFALELMSSKGTKAHLDSSQGRVVQQWHATFLTEWAISFSSNISRCTVGRPNHTCSRPSAFWNLCMDLPCTILCIFKSWLKHNYRQEWVPATKLIHGACGPFLGALLLSCGQERWQLGSCSCHHH